MKGRRNDPKIKAKDQTFREAGWPTEAVDSARTRPTQHSDYRYEGQKFNKPPSSLSLEVKSKMPHSESDETTPKKPWYVQTGQGDAARKNPILADREIIETPNGLPQKKADSIEKMPKQYGNRTYLQHGEQAPAGATVHQGPMGGRYYVESEQKVKVKPLVSETKHFSAEASELDNGGCPTCGSKMVTVRDHYTNDADHELTHSDVKCPKCGAQGVVFND